MLDNAWEVVLTALLEQFQPDIDWDLTNRDNQTALELSAEDERNCIAEIFGTYAPDEARSAHSSHGDSDTDEEVFSDLESENFEHLTPQAQARVRTLHEQFLQQKRRR